MDLDHRPLDHLGPGRGDDCMTSSESIGPIVTDVDVENAVLATLKRWMPTYLREMERHSNEPEKSFPDIASWRAADTPEDRFPEQMIPAIQVMLTSDTEIITKSESADGLFSGTIDCLVATTEPETARRMAALYQFAMGLALVQHPHLDGSIEVAGFGWKKSGVPAVGKPDERWLSLGTIEVSILVSNIFNPYLGPVNPQEPDGEGVPPAWPRIESHEFILNKESPFARAHLFPGLELYPSEELLPE